MFQEPPDLPNQVYHGGGACVKVIFHKDRPPRYRLRPDHRLGEGPEAVSITLNGVPGLHFMQSCCIIFSDG